MPPSSLSCWIRGSYFICHAIFIGKIFICFPFDGIVPPHLSFRKVFTEISFHACCHRKWKGTIKKYCGLQSARVFLRMQILPFFWKPSAWGRACWSGVFVCLFRKFSLGSQLYERLRTTDSKRGTHLGTVDLRLSSVKECTTVVMVCRNRGPWNSYSKGHRVLKKKKKAKSESAKDQVEGENSHVTSWQRWWLTVKFALDRSAHSPVAPTLHT